MPTDPTRPVICPTELEILLTGTNAPSVKIPGSYVPPDLKSTLRISVVICTFNEAQNVADVLLQIPMWVDDVLLVDARSTDGTVNIAQTVLPRLRVLYQPGAGKDDALTYGVKNADGEIVVTLDSDGETDPGDLGRIIEPLLQGYDFAKGSRFASGWRNKPFLRLIGNWLIAETCNVLYGTRFTDLCSGFNAFWKTRTAEVGLWSNGGWSYEPRIVGRALRRGLRVAEVPQTYRGRVCGRSKLPNWRQGFNSIWYLFVERFRHPKSRM